MPPKDAVGSNPSTATAGPRTTRSSQSGERWAVPGEWLEFYKSPFAKRIEQSSEVLAKLEEMKQREEAKLVPQPWIKSQRADLIFAAVIIAYGLVTGIDVEITVQTWPDEVSKQYETVMLVIQTVFTVVFLAELFLRVRAEGLRYCLPFVLTCASPEPGEPRKLQLGLNFAGFFDTAIILVGTAEVAVTLIGIEGVSLSAAGPMRMLRLLRLVRIMKGLMVFEQLRLLCIGMVSSLGAVFWAFMLLTTIMYLGALFCVILLGKNAAISQYFGGVGQALFTHFMLITLEAWPDISDAVMDASTPLWALYFIVFICISSLCLMNLVTGVVCEKLLEVSGSGAAGDSAVNQLDAFRKDRETFREELLKVFRTCDLDHSDTIDREEFEALRERPEMRRLFKLMEVSDDVSSADLFRMVDVKGTGLLDFEGLARALLRLRGSSSRIHSLMLQKDILRRHQREAEQVAELEASLCEHARAELSAVEDAVAERIESLKASALPRQRRKTAHFGADEQDMVLQGCAKGSGAGQLLQAETEPPLHLEGVEEAPPPQKQLELEGAAEATLEAMEAAGAASPEAAAAASPEANRDEEEGVEDRGPAEERAAEKTEESLAPEAAAPPRTVALGRQPWVKEAGTRLEQLIGELDVLHSWAKDLLVADPHLDSEADREATGPGGEIAAKAP